MIKNMFKFGLVLGCYILAYFIASWFGSSFVTRAIVIIFSCIVLYPYFKNAKLTYGVFAAGIAHYFIVAVVMSFAIQE